MLEENLVPTFNEEKQKLMIFGNCQTINEILEDNRQMSKQLLKESFRNFNNDVDSRTYITSNYSSVLAKGSLLVIGITLLIFMLNMIK